jgi:hypothetical protein
MIAARNDKTIRGVGQSMSIGDKHFEFLGSPMTPRNDVSLEIQQRVQTANRCFLGLRKHSFRPEKIHHSHLIRPVVLYGSETWVLTKKEENRLLVFERKVLRTICGPKLENGVYRRRYSHELDKEFNSPNALSITKISR